MRIIRKKDKVIGKVIGKTYYTRRNSENIFRMYNSVNISENVLNNLKDMEVEDIEVNYMTKEGKERRLRVKLTKFLNGIDYEYGKDKQKCVELYNFEEISEPKQRGLAEYFSKKNKVGVI